MSRLDALVFFCRRLVYGESCKTFHCRRCQSKLSCRLMWQAWHVVTFLRVYWKLPKVDSCEMGNTLARFPEDDLHVSWQGQHFGGVHHAFVWQAQHFRHVVLRVFGDRSVK